MSHQFVGALVLLLFSSTGFAQDWQTYQATDQRQSSNFSENEYDEDEFLNMINPRSCQRASATQISEVNRGYAKLQNFLSECARATNGSQWCNELARPNPASVSMFHCTYGTSMPHNLIHPDERTWENAFQAVKLVQELEGLGVKTCIIYNWWRPEPYNKNVGGAPGRHPLGTSVDVRFCSMADMEKAHRALCEWRKQGRVRAVGYYGTTALHFGVGDKLGNTWGKECL